MALPNRVPAEPAPAVPHPHTLLDRRRVGREVNLQLRIRELGLRLALRWAGADLKRRDKKTSKLHTPQEA